MEKPTHLTVSREWLATCGMLTLDGVVLKILNTRDFGFRGKFYKVALPDGRDWEVWDARGVAVFTLLEQED